MHFMYQLVSLIMPTRRQRNDQTVFSLILIF